MTLLERLQSEGPSRGLDEQVVLANGLVPDGMERCGDAWWAGGGAQWHAPHYTEDLTAVIRDLVSEGMNWVVGKMAGEFTASVWNPGQSFEKQSGQSDHTPALALLIALTKAKESQ